MQADLFKELPTQEDLKLGFQHGFEAVVERRRSLYGHTARSSVDPFGAQVYKNYIV